MNRGATILTWAMTVLAALSLPERVAGQEGKTVPTPSAPSIVELSKVKAEPPRATDPILIDVGRSRFYKIDDYTGPVTWEMTGDSILLKEIEKTTVIGLLQQGETEPSYPEVPAGAVILWGKKSGVSELSAWGVVGGKPKKLLTRSFRVGSAPEPPVEPPPAPKPGVDPKPTPAPTPTPASTSPFAANGLHVMIVYESEAELPAGQQAIVFGKAFRDYLAANCAVGPDGKTKAWQIWDKNVDASTAPKVYRDAFARPRSSIPWIMIGNGTTGYEGALPASVEATTKLIDQYRTK